MAWLQADPSGNYHVSFRFGGRKFKRSLRTKNAANAEGRRLRLEENIRLVESGRMEVPMGADIPLFLLSDGKIDCKTIAVQNLTLSKLFNEYLAGLPQESLEVDTLYTIRIHMEHIERILGSRFAVAGLAEADLQDYVLRRSREQGRHGKRVSPITIKKELGTFSSVWSWAMRAEHVTRPFPNKGLRFPKVSEKPPFQTWEEIERKIARSQMAEREAAELWECLFLMVPQIDELLSHVQTVSTYPYLHPMMAFAAYTGARRSELMRSQLDDIDLHAATAIIREKKRVRGKVTTRRVPLSPQLQSLLKAWLEIHPGGEFTFCHSTGADTQKGLAKEQARDHFKRTLTKSKWKVVHGWHVFRHSFCSNCAAAGIDQRVINAWVGHQTEDMVKRYRHLIPNQEQAAIRQVFAKAGQGG